MCHSETVQRESYTRQLRELELSYSKKLHALDAEAAENNMAKQQLVNRLADTGCILEVLLLHALGNEALINQLKTEKQIANNIINR